MAIAREEMAYLGAYRDVDFVTAVAAGTLAGQVESTCCGDGDEAAVNALAVVIIAVAAAAAVDLVAAAIVAAATVAVAAAVAVEVVVSDAVLEVMAPYCRVDRASFAGGDDAAVVVAAAMAVAAAVEDDPAAVLIVEADGRPS